jgi:glycosyltransferase involved in cell wall biosynthesis
MKIGIFIEKIEKNIDYKDLGQIARGLKDLGNEVFFITTKSNFKDFIFPVIEASIENLEKEKFFKEIDCDVIIFYTWLSIRFNRLIESAKNSGKRVIIKLDSDGRFGYPILISRLRGFTHIKNFKEFIDYFSWVFRYIAFGTFLFKKKIKQLYIADKVIIESPQALVNLFTFLFYHKKLDLSILDKCCVIPNPVDKAFIRPPGNKENIILCVADWENRAKNRKNLFKLIKKFLEIKKNWRFVIIGNGSNYFSSLSNEKVIIKDEVPHGEIIEYFSKAKIFLLPSFWEGFNISASEAVCSGCSIVGTPLECLFYLSNNGFSGTISYDFNYKSLLSALLIDVYKWENGIYNAKLISDYWQNILNREKIAKMIVDIINK